MRFDCLFEPLNGWDVFEGMLESLQRNEAADAYGVEDTQRAHLIAAAIRRLDRTALVVVSNDAAAQRMAEDLNLLLDGAARYLPARELTFLKAAASSREIGMRRLEVLGDCVLGRVKALVVPFDVITERVMPRERFESCVMTVKEGMTLEPADMIAMLTRAGYERVQTVEGRGQCALRGGILDVYPIGDTNALRIEFFDDEVDSIRSFDVLTQRSVSRRTEARFYPASETLRTEAENAQAAAALRMLLEAQKQGEDHQKSIEKQFNLMPIEEFLRLSVDEEEAVPRASVNRVRGFAAVLDALQTGRSFDGEASLIPVLLHFEAGVQDYLTDPFIVLDQPDRLRERGDNRALEFTEQYTAALERGQALSVQGELLTTWQDFLGRIAGKSILLMNTFLKTEQDVRPQRLCRFEGRNASGYISNIKQMAQDLRRWKDGGWRIALMAGGHARGERLQASLREQGVYALLPDEEPEAIEPGDAVILTVSVGKGFLYDGIRLAVLAESDIYGVSRQRTHARSNSASRIDAFTELNVGDYVVHENHGIGQYMGTVRLASEGTYRDFLHIRYQGSDKLYVPTDQLDRVQKYIGSEGAVPKLNRLSGGEWQKQKSKVKQSIQAIAGDLVKLYAKRETVKGFAFDPDTPWQREFEDNFPYEETPDQVAAIEDIKRDMESPRVMDRLLCGDVGYGKTEVALRAIFKAVMSGKQAAMLAPTTILVQQHYKTMLKRFEGFPVRVEFISRFKTSAQQKQIIAQLKAGEIDVVVGTHRLLGKDVEFKNLGLLVVDEEQRFGVTHKEAIKRMKESIDVLTLTATPIPRTLHMSMVGIRDMSLLQSPPEERYPVQTYVVEYSDSLVRDAILRELGRGGQVYMLHNRVQSIDIIYQRLKKLVPEARIAVGHGQMREHALEDVMMDFYEGRSDVLLCTTIIESGLDVPTANTLIVLDADRFGLAQLYQIRGRVGRSNRLAYAYFTVSPAKVLTETADKRLSTIREFTEFGSGFRVAMRDLEIRGAGNLLGSEQSGFMASVGYDLYIKMVEQAVKELRGDTRMGDIETRVDIKTDAFIPQEYIGNDLTRIEMYKKIAGIRSSEDQEDLVEELIDRFGDPPVPVMTLIDISRLKNLCSRLGIDYVTSKQDTLNMRFSMSSDMDLVGVLKAIQGREPLKMKGGNPPTLVYFSFRSTAEQLMKGCVKELEQVIAAYEAVETKEAQ